MEKEAKEGKPWAQPSTLDRQTQTLIEQRQSKQRHQVLIQHYQSNRCCSSLLKAVEPHKHLSQNITQVFILSSSKHFSVLSPRLWGMLFSLSFALKIKFLQGKAFSLIGCECYQLYILSSFQTHRKNPNQVLSPHNLKDLGLQSSTSSWGKAKAFPDIMRGITLKQDSNSTHHFKCIYPGVSTSQTHSCLQSNNRMNSITKYKMHHFLKGQLLILSYQQTPHWTFSECHILVYLQVMVCQSSFQKQKANKQSATTNQPTPTDDLQRSKRSPKPYAFPGRVWCINILSYSKILHQLTGAISCLNCTSQSQLKAISEGHTCLQRVTEVHYHVHSPMKNTCRWVSYLVCQVSTHSTCLF